MPHRGERNRVRINHFIESTETKESYAPAYKVLNDVITRVFWGRVTNYKEYNDTDDEYVSLRGDLKNYTCVLRRDGNEGANRNEFARYTRTETEAILETIDWTTYPDESGDIVYNKYVMSHNEEKDVCAKCRDGLLWEKADPTRYHQMLDDIHLM